MKAWSKAVIVWSGLTLCAFTLRESASAQIVFNSNDFPSQIGEYFRGYIYPASTNPITVGGLPGETNGPQRWDLSWAEESFEIAQETDIVDPADANSGADAALFPDATYAEQDTDDYGDQAWRFYSIEGDGRVYYGFDDAVNFLLSPVAVFKNPTLEFPCPLRYGQAWNRTVDWDIQNREGGTLGTVQFTSQAVVDAYGAVVLPALGAVPALRVDEVDTYVVTPAGKGPMVNCFREYYWLVRGIGIAAEVVSEPEASIPPMDFTSAGSTLRVFDASDPKDLLLPVNGLQLQLTGSDATMTWGASANGGSYRIESASDVTSGSWQLLALPTVNSWSGDIGPLGPQGFFRVYSKP